MIKNLLVIGLTFFKVFIFAQNFNITYGFPDVTTTSGQMDPSICPTLTGLNFGSFNSIGTNSNPNASGRFSFTGWPVGALNGDDNYGNYTAVLSPTVFYEMTISVDPGYTLNLNSLSFDVRRSGTGIRTYCVRSSLDNFTGNLSVSTGTSSNLSVIPNDLFFWKYDSISTSNDQRGSRIDFNSTFSVLTNTLTFRFYAWNAEANGGSFSLDNVNFTGMITSTLNLSGTHESFIAAHPSKLLVYPNPCNTGKLVVETNYMIEKLMIETEIGNTIIFFGENCPFNKNELDVSTFESGLYLLKVSGKDKTHVKKILIKK